jgi:hypothetical protein
MCQMFIVYMFVPSQLNKPESGPVLCRLNEVEVSPIVDYRTTVAEIVSFNEDRRAGSINCQIFSG